MPQPTLVWRTPPDALARAIERYGERVLIAVAAVAQRLATILEGAAKQNATWTDRTGNARSGLFGTSEADLARHMVVIYLSHGPVIDYGVYLELAHGGRYGVVMRTIESHLPQLHAMLNDIFG